MFHSGNNFNTAAAAGHNHRNNINSADHHQIQSGMENIVRALELIHSPTSTNEIRQQASEFLELQKNEKSAAENGFSLSSQANNSPVVRHFGLSLLEHVVRHKSSGLPADQFTHLRDLILNLAEEIQIQDPPYVRNKVAQLWAEVAKRSWGIDWLGMDESLVKMWNRELVHKEFVLSILETLSEDTFYREDTASSLRGTDLNRALVEIFTPYSVFQEVYPERDHRVELRYGSEGWLGRICDFLHWCTQNMQAQREVKECTLKALETLRSVMSWSIPKAVSSSQCVQRTCQVLAFGDEQVLLAGVETLHALYGRTNYEIEEFQGLIDLIYGKDNLSLLRKLYEWSVVDPNSIDESRYAISKKLSELMSYVAGFLEESHFASQLELQGGPDLGYFFEFLISILRNQSLTVSIPILHSWSRLLSPGKLKMDITSLFPPLLEICTQRLVRYETLPEDSDDPTIIFLNEDIDTIPERHAFVGNYRRYCSQVIGIIVQGKPQEAIPHILSGIDFKLNNLYEGLPPFDASTFKKSSIPLLRADTQFTVAEATLKGYNKWVASLGKLPQQDEQQRREIEDQLETWMLNVMQRNFEDPIIKQRIIKLSVDFSSTALDSKPSFALKVLEHILMTHVTDRPEFPAYSDSVKELHNLATFELRRLATRYADYFSTFYDLLEPKIRELVATGQMENRPQAELYAILLIIMHRANNVDPYLRQTRLQSFVEPVKQTWANEEFKQVASSFDGFCGLLGVKGVGPYLQAKQAHKIEDWSTIALDEEGKRVQDDLTVKYRELPLRETKTMFAVSTEKLKKNDPAYQIACDLWRDTIPLILPTLLQLVSHAHALHNPANWTGLPEEMQPVVGQILTDRFWQAGISTGSKEEFYARIATSKATLEGFSSLVRGKIRGVRESCYSILYCMSRLGDCFYGFEELSVPLSQALFTNSTYLSSHQFSVLLSVSRCLVDDCPVVSRGHFLPPMLANLFTQIDKKITAEWDMIERRKTGVVDDNLTEEMKDESILRQLTYSAVVMLASLLDPQRGDPDDPTKSSEPAPPAASIRHFVLNSPDILEPVIMFCTHVLRMHDTRCCSIITRVLRSILHDFAPPLDTPTATTIREFISSDVLKACITSVHEPYFVDMQRDLAQLIASIWILYGPSTGTPRSVILSLPGISTDKVAKTESSLLRSTTTRQQRALVLDLLEGLRGVSISEQGRISSSREDRMKARSAMQARYMTVEMEGQQNENAQVDTNDGPDLSGVADMFG